MQAQQKKRVQRPKTLEAQFADLDDNLYLLDTAWKGIDGRELSWIKVLAVVLRSLVCHSAKERGLLWKMADATGADDTVEAVFVRGANRDHPAFEKLQLAYWRLLPQVDGPFKSDRHSLRVLIEGGSAFYFKGQDLTCEALIKDICQEMGAAHEADGASEHVAAIFETFMGDWSQALCVLRDISQLVSEVGERVVQAATAAGQFTRLRHAAVRFEPISEALAELAGRRWSFDVNADLPAQGTIVLAIAAPYQWWLVDYRQHTFRLRQQGRLSVVAIKGATGLFHVTVEGLDDQPHVFLGMLPVRKGTEEVGLAIRWDAREVSLITTSGSVVSARSAHVPDQAAAAERTSTPSLDDE